MQKIIKQKKILFITSTFPRDEMDIQVPWMGELVRRLKVQGVSLDVFAPAYKGLSSHKYFGIDVYRFRYAPSKFEILTHEEGAVFKVRQKPWFIFLAVFYLFWGILAILKKVRKTYYDVIHVHWPFPQGIFGIIAKLLTRGKLILTFYGAEFTLAKRIPLGISVLHFLLKHADQVIAISNFTKRKIQEIADVPVKIIPFTAAFSSNNLEGKFKKNTRKASDKKKRILFVGRLIERKGVSYLIKAMPKILENIQVQLDIIGTGLMFFELKKEVEKLGLGKVVFFRGRVDEKKIKNFYLNCDVFALPAVVDRWGDTEGLGVVLLEAMSFGKPVIASKVGGITDIIRSGVNGLLVPEKNSDDLAKAIIKILLNQKLRKRLAKNGLLTVKKSFSWNKIIQETVRLYE